MYYDEAGPSTAAQTTSFCEASVASTPLPSRRTTSASARTATTLDEEESSSPIQSTSSPLSNAASAGRASNSRRTRSGWSKWAGIAVTMTALLFGSASAGPANNVTSLSGTWSSGSGAVVTGLEFFNPGTGEFTWPKAAGQAYSFTNDGHWEQALYLYETNPAKPSCVSGQLIWQHGTYVLHNNNSLTLTPFKGDGRQQIADRCASQSSTVSSYNQVETMMGFDILLDTHYTKAAYKLQLYEFDGTPKPYLWQIYNPPQMLPTEQLHVEIIGSVAD